MAGSIHIKVQTKYILAYTCRNVHLDQLRRGYQNVASWCDDFDDGSKHAKWVKEI